MLAISLIAISQKYQLIKGKCFWRCQSWNFWQKNKTSIFWKYF